VEKKLQDPLNTSCTEKLVTHQHYGTFSNNNNNSNYAVFTIQDYAETKAYSILLKYIVFILSTILITLDIKNIKNRIHSQDEIIAEVKFILVS
jgi:hypothetical protein